MRHKAKTLKGDEVIGVLVERRRDGFPHTYIYDNSYDELEISEYCGDSDSNAVDLKDLFVEVDPSTAQALEG